MLQKHEMYKVEAESAQRTWQRTLDALGTAPPRRYSTTLERRMHLSLLLGSNPTTANRPDLGLISGAAGVLQYGHLHVHPCYALLT